MANSEKPQSIWHTIFENLDGYAFALIAAYALYRFADPIATTVLPRLSRFKVGGLEIETQALWRDMDTAANSAEEHNKVAPAEVESTVKKSIRITSVDRERAVARAAARAQLFRYRRMLWVDDNPYNNALEMSLLRRLGVDIIQRQDNDSALGFLRSHGASCDIVISDIDRDGTPTGIELLEAYREEGYDMPFVFYVSVVDPNLPIPLGAFGLTNRPDELLHLVVDAFERRGSVYLV